MSEESSEAGSLTGAVVEGQYLLSEPGRLRKRFHELTAQWQEETWFLSNAASIAKHPAYQEIIKMGAAAVPLILQEMRARPHHWFWALNIINQLDVVREEHTGNINAMTQDWLEWGEANHLI